MKSLASTVILALAVLLSISGLGLTGVAHAQPNASNPVVVYVSIQAVQLDTYPPQAYSFAVFTQTIRGHSIMNLHWDFGDGVGRDVPYCCPVAVSEVQYHTYTQPGFYRVVVTAFDNFGYSGQAVANVNWALPVPEYPTYLLPVLVSFTIAMLALAYRKHLNGGIKASLH